jgi:very-short-patch-repair endonuclease
MTQYPPTAHLKTFARSLRRRETPHEHTLWQLLRDRRFLNYRFRRQVPIGPYIADFVCYGRRLIIELDGSQHADSPTDVTRDAYLAREGFRILRVWNNELIENRDGVLEAILAALRAD